ncbi:hypothetical protein LB467_16680 [Salegentibacter sp. JZCK2]|uniref:hypothetical protein n=1 Tax=Salegentibacter tibetensis TaxID=2873600 RepID=UPI001CC95B48|nr:hypothetical protein [Salegentibacter tibetensis]MBZ9731328.1 hypothetical protein [Salegentibacter tibetensis]
MILQKRNSGGLKCWGCSAFEVLAPVAIERPARVSRAKAKSAILHSFIMAQEVRGNAAIMPNYVNIAWEKCFCPFPFSNFFWIFLSVLNTLKSVAGNYQRAEARKWIGKMELRTLLEKHQKIKIKKTFLAINAVFIGLNEKLKSDVLFFDEHTIHFYRNHD